MENITFCDVDAEDVRYVDPNFLKLFKISQLIIEYLVHTQDYLSDTQSILSQDLQSTLDKLELITSTFEKQTVECNAMKKENRNLKKTLYAYQLMARVPGYTGDAGGGNESAAYHRCTYCTKVFKAHVYLENHSLRRHPESPRQPPHTDTNSFASKDRGMGNFGQMYPQFYPMMMGGGGPPTTLESLNQTVSNLSAKMKETEDKLRGEMEERLAKELQVKQKSLQQNYDQERLKNEKDIQILKAEIHQQLSDERAAFEEEKIALETIVKQAQARNKKSRFGVLEDDEEGRLLGPTQAAELERKHNAALAEMNAKFEEQMNNMKKALAYDQQKEKEDLESKLEKASTQISTLRSLLKEEHKLNVERDEKVKGYFGKRKHKTDHKTASPLESLATSAVGIIAGSVIGGGGGGSGGGGSGGGGTGAGGVVHGGNNDSIVGGLPTKELASAAIGLLVNHATSSDAQGGGLVSAAAGIASMLLAGQSSGTRDVSVTDSKSRDVTPIISRDIDVKDVPVAKTRSIEIVPKGLNVDENSGSGSVSGSSASGSASGSVSGSGSGSGSDSDSADNKPLSAIVAEKKKESKERSEAVSRAKETPNKQSLQPISWNDALSLMSDYKYTPLPSCPWVTTMYNQSTNEISKEQNAIMKQVESELAKYGILEKSVSNQWQDEGVKQDVKKKWAAFQKEVIVHKDTRAPLYKEMRVYIDSKITDVVRKNFKLRQKPVSLEKLNDSGRGRSSKANDREGNPPNDKRGSSLPPPISTKPGSSPPKKKAPAPPPPTKAPAPPPMTKTRDLDAIPEKSNSSKESKSSKDSSIGETSHKSTTPRDIKVPIEVGPSSPSKESPTFASPIATPKLRAANLMGQLPERRSLMESMNAPIEMVKNIGQMFSSKRSSGSLASNSLKDIVMGKPKKSSELHKEADIDDHPSGSSSRSSFTSSGSESSSESDDATDSQTHSATYDDESSVKMAKADANAPSKSSKSNAKETSKNASKDDGKGTSLNNSQKYPSDMIMENSEDPTSDDISTDFAPVPRKTSTSTTTATPIVVKSTQPTAVFNSTRASVDKKPPVSSLQSTLKVPIQVMAMNKPSDDSFDISDLSGDDISEDNNKSGPLPQTNQSQLVRKSTGEIAPSALKPLSKSSSKATSSQSVNFKLNSNESPVEKLVKTTAFGSVPAIAVSSKARQDGEVSESLDLDSFSDSENSRDKQPIRKESPFVQ
ncbi:UNVERIFIED_CONTAM: Zinc finger protein dzip1l, partial [Siphonaria sp. JEL0065]